MRRLLYALFTRLSEEALCPCGLGTRLFGRRGNHYGGYVCLWIEDRLAP